MDCFQLNNNNLTCSFADLTLALSLDFIILLAFWFAFKAPKTVKAKLQISSEKQSRALTHLLRHGGSGGKYRKCVGPNGYAAMRVVMSLLDLTENQIVNIVKNCPKQRFEILSNTEGTFVRCVQGHSDYMNIDPELLFERLTQETVSQYLTHGTKPSNVGAILDLGLSRMSRSHIHFVEGIVDATHYYIPGFRTGSQRTIVVDAHAAMARGIVFYRATNGVILTSGAGGVLSSEFIVKEKSRLQIFDNAGDAIKNVNNFVAEARPILGQVSGFMEDIRPTIGQIDALLAKSNVAADSATRTLGSLESFFQGGDKSMLNRIMRVIDVVINVSLAADGRKLWSLLYNVSTRFGMEITSEIAKLFGATRAVQQIHVDMANQVIGGWTDKADVTSSVTSILSSFENTIGNHREITVAGLGATIAILLQFCLGLPRNGSIDGILKFFGDRCRNMKNIVDFGKSSATMFGAIGDWIVTSCFPNLAKPHGLDEYVSGYDAWTKEILELMNPENPVGVRMMKDKKLVYRIDWLFKKGISYSSVVKGLSIDPKLRAHYSKMFKIIEELRKQCDFTGVFGNRPRCKPLIIHLFGESGVGKSGMTWPLASDLVAFFSDKLETAQDFASEVYFRNVEQEFWDGYSGQAVTVYDDFGQRTDSSTAPNEEFMEVIRTGNLAPYPLHMAQLEEKKRAKFVSNVVMLTSNEPSYTVGSLTFPDAYRRRIDLMVKVTIKPEFSKPGYSKTSGTTVNRLDRSKCSGPCDLRPYLLELYDPETCQAKDAPTRNNPPEWMNDKAMEYEEFLDLCLQTANASMSDSMLFNRTLDTRMTKERFNRIKARQQINVEWNKDLDMTALDLSDLRSTPIEELRKTLNSFLNLKNMLLLVGVILAGVGIWKLFKSKDKKKSHHSGGRLGAIETEGVTSGDARTHVVKTVCMEATTSGDSQTNKTKVISTEGNVSGDAKTNQIRTIATEATASGDSKTNQTKTVRTEACASGDPRTRKLQTIRTEGEIPAELQAWKDKTAQDLISHRILNNEYKIELDGEFALNGLFVRHNVMLTPKHLWNRMVKATNMTIWNIYGSEFTVPVRELKVVDIQDRSGETKDAMLIKFPAYVNAHSDLVKHFQQMPELSVRRVDVCVPTLRKIGNQRVAMILGNAAASFETVCLDIGDTTPEIITMRQGISYNLNTIGGDCGSPVIANENTFIRKICGIHVAAAADGTRAYGQSITRADLERALEILKNGGESVLETDFDDLPNLAIVSANFQLNQEISCEDVLKAFDMPADTFGYAGRCTDQKTPPGQTDLRKSEIHGYVEPITKPAYLYRSDVNLVHKNMEKCAINTPHIPQNEVKRAVNEVKSKLLTGDSRQRLNKVLTYEEAVAGSQVSEFISGLNRSSSAGYGWEKEPGKPGKTTWFGDSDYIFSEEVRAVVNDRIALAKVGKRAPTVWVDTLKDERRPIEKVNQLKTRVFAFGPQDFTIAFRMYFLGFIAHIMENRITNEQSLGTNVYGHDWARTAKVLQKRGKKVFAGDFSTFDGTLNSCIMSEFAQVANEFYDDGPENALIREVLMLDVYNSLHLCSGKFISLTHSQPSGNPLTTVLNSFYNSVSMRIAFYRLCSNERFDDHVTMVSYGDDNVVNFSDEISEKFNQNTVTEAYASFGMIYTDEAKTGGEVQPWRRIDEVAYLKRNFVKDGAFWRCPLALETILETPNWVRKSPDSRLATRENVENSVMELAQHTRPVFDEWSQRIVKAFYDATSEYPEVKTFDTYRHDWEDLILGN